MIASLRGVVIAKEPEKIVLEAGGVGHEIHLTPAAVSRLPAAGEEAFLLVVPSYAMYGGGETLYGFLSDSEKALFCAFRDEIPGTGAKKALEYLDKASKSLPDFRRAVLDRDEKLLTGVFGFTKKTATKIVEALKDKLEDVRVAGAPHLARADEAVPATGAWGQALSALQALGYRPSEVRAALTALAEEHRGGDVPAEHLGAPGVEEALMANPRDGESVLNPGAAPVEEASDRALRPKTLAEFIGQDSLKENLRVFIKAAKQRGEPLDHCLFYAPPGLGKTTLANILAREMGVNLRTASGPILVRVGDLAALLTDISEGDVFFIDEIHRLNPIVEEALYPVMEDYTFFISTGKGPAASTLKLSVPRFTLVGATTRSGLLTGPLRDRFGIVAQLGFYGPEELRRIVLRSAGLLGVPTDQGGADEIARRCRGTPRIANRLLRRVRDFAQVDGGGKIDVETAKHALGKLEVDAEGLDPMDRRLLRAVIEKFDGGPVGVENLAIAVSEELDTVTDVVEPFLIQAGFLARTPRGRVATPKAYAHLGLKAPRRPLDLL